MRERFFVGSAVFLLSVLASGSALAQMEGSLELGGFGGVSRATCSGAAYAIDRNSTVECTCGDGATVGFWFGYDFSSHVGAEVAVSTPWNKHETSLRVYGDTLAAVSSDPLILWYAGPVAYLPVGRFVPYVALGVGTTSFLDHRTLLVNVGGGVKMLVGERFLVRVDIRHNRMKARPTETVEDPFSSNELTVGIAYVRR